MFKIDVKQEVFWAWGRLLFTPGLDEAFSFYAERIGYAVDVIKIADNLRGIVDGSVIKPYFAKMFYIFSAHYLR